MITNKWKLVVGIHQIHVAGSEIKYTISALVSYFSQREEQSTNLSQQSINDQIKDLSERGLEPDCYVALTGLMCIWCDPNTSEFIGKPNNPEYIFPTAYAYLCPSYCDELFFKCFDDLGLF